MERPRFPTDISRDDFERVRALLDSARKTTRPKLHSTYDVLCAILFLVRNEVPWRDLPATFPPWRSVHHHFTQWTSSSGAISPLEMALLELGIDDAAAAVRNQIRNRSRLPH